MAYSEKLSDIIVLEKCEVYATKKQYSICFSLNQSKKDSQLSQHFADYPRFELDLYLLMLDPSVQFE